jgi:hypothetical protein
MAATQSAERKLDKSRYFAATGYGPHEAQLEIHADRHRHRALSNGRRWGKTLVGGKEAEVTAFIKNRLGQPQHGWVVGPNYTDCEKEFRVVWNTFKALGIDTTAPKWVNNRDSGNMHIKTGWGWELECRSAMHPESLVGEGLDFVLLVEAGRLTRRTFAQYIRPALSDKRGWSLSTGVPEIASDTSLLFWAYMRGQDSSKRMWKSWRKPSWTNTIVFPGGRTDPEILEAEDDLTEDEFRRQYGGEFVERVGLVMKEWEDEVHLANLKYNPDWPLYAAVDYGYTNPFVWLWIQVDNDNNVYVLGEHYIQFQDVGEICERTLKHHPLIDKVAAFYPDPAGPDDSNTIARKLKIVPRLNTGGELRTRLGLIRRALKVPEHEVYGPQQPRLLVDRSCTKLRWEMAEGYRWPEHKDEANKNDSELPMDKDNHGPEALGRFFKGYFDVVDEKPRKTRQSSVKIRR